MPHLSRVLSLSLLVCGIITCVYAERMGLCQRLCARQSVRRANLCIKKHCENFIKNRLFKYGKRASTTIVGVKTAGLGATIDINVRTQNLLHEVNNTAWRGLIYLNMLPPNDRRRLKHVK